MMRKGARFWVSRCATLAMACIAVMGGGLSARSDTPVLTPSPEVGPTTNAIAASTCPSLGGSPMLLCSGFWQQLRRQGEAGDSQSVNWMNALQAALPVDQDYIQLAGTEDDGNQNGVAVYDPPSSVSFTTVYCLQGSCDGFPRSHQYQVRADPNTYLPATSADSPLAILDHTDVNTSTFVWFHQACPPHYTGNAWCAANSDQTRWTATAMSTQLWNSTGLDRCYPLKHPDLYSSVDLSNSGHRGLPSSYTAIKYWEVAPPAPGIVHMLELSVPVGVVSGAGYFPLAGREGQLQGSIPEGAILHLKSLSAIPPHLPNAVRLIAMALYYYGAVVSEGSSIDQASLNVEALYVEGDPAKTWSGLDVFRGSLAGIPLDTTHFEFMKKGAPGFQPLGGPTHDQWQSPDCENQPAP